jgi:lipoate-protein ligase A
LVCHGKKIAWPCLRRRGSKIIVQGPVHVHLDSDTADLFSRSIAKNLSSSINKSAMEIKVYDRYIQKALTIAKERYSNNVWNNKY